MKAKVVTLTAGRWIFVCPNWTTQLVDYMLLEYIRDSKEPTLF